jgi:hypothetical protein
MIFTSFISWSIYLFLVYEYLKKKFPEKTDDVLINVSYYTIYLFSKLQIVLKKRTNEVYLYLKNNETYGKYLDKTLELKNKLSDTLVALINKYSNTHYNSDNNTDYNTRDNIDYNKDCQKHERKTEEDLLFEFIQDNRLQNSMFKQELIEKLESTDINTDLLDLMDFCDFVTIRDSNNNIKIINKDLITLSNITSEDCELLKITPITYKPILCELITDNRNIKISFSHKDNNYNYLVVGNHFNSVFLKYFMKTHFKYNIKENTDYILSILDDKVENISICENDVLKIEEKQMVKM